MKVLLAIPGINKIIQGKIKEKLVETFGGRFHEIVIGGAAFNPEAERFFRKIGFPFTVGYGMTECGPLISYTSWDTTKLGASGKPVDTLEVTIDSSDPQKEIGEIILRGENVMLGYYKRPDRTREVIDEEGWFHTGDMGALEEGQYLKITDRKKEIFKTSTGKYIAPQVIEQRLKESPFIEQIIVVGENRKYAAALIIPNFEHVKNWCAVKRISFSSHEQMIKNPILIRRIQKEVDHFNQDLGQTEKIKKFCLLADEWSVETGELSPTLKLRRKFIQEKYTQEINDTYHSSEYRYRMDPLQ